MEKVISTTPPDNTRIGLSINDLDCAKEAINNLPQNHNLKYVTYLMKQFSP